MSTNAKKPEQARTSRFDLVGTVMFSYLSTLAALTGAPIAVYALLFLLCLAAAILFGRNKAGRSAKDQVESACTAKFAQIPGCLLIFLFAPDIWILLVVLTGTVVLTGILYAFALYSASKCGLLQGDLAFMNGIIGFFIIWDFISAILIRHKIREHR